MDKSQSITIDGISYAIEQFSQPVQQAVGIYNTFNADLQKAQLEVIKLQAALQTIGNQINEAVKKELAEKAAAAVPAEVPAQVAPKAAKKTKA